MRQGRVIHLDGAEGWYCDDNLHRLDGPAIVYPDGSYEWWWKGQLHRCDGPAVGYSNGTKVWYQNGFIHRIGGPALIRSDGGREWYHNGDLHRLDGPAIIYANGMRVWAVDDVTVPIAFAEVDGGKYIFTSLDLMKREKYPSLVSSGHGHYSLDNTDLALLRLEHAVTEVIYE